LTGSTTVANLFYNIATGRIGLVGLWDAVAFDEVADLEKMPREVVTTLKTYCESGTFARGKEPLSGAASIALFGNQLPPTHGATLCFGPPKDPEVAYLPIVFPPPYSL
jgi:ATP-dependent Lon protease